MKIKRINISHLEEFIRSGEYRSYETVPITPERAWSQARNPHAQPDDPALWLALDDTGHLLGFIGSLPAKNHRTGERMGWNSCWWVDPERGNEAAMPLFYTFLKQWDLHVAFSDMTENTFSIVRQMDFCHLREEELFIGYFRMSFKEVLLPRKKLLYPLVPLFALMVPIINLFQLLRISTTGSNLKGMELEVKEKIDSGMLGFIRQHHPMEFSQRDEVEFNWITAQKWLVEGTEESREIEQKYPFSYTCMQFDWKWIVTRLKGEINTIMLASERDHILKILYYYGEAPGFALMAIKSLVASNTGIRRVIFAHPALLANRGMLNSLLLMKRIKIRYTGVSRKLAGEYPREMIMQLGDGDAVFT
ncbi:MAG: hypothetical protein JXR52_07275 [Bacteroidales bacterium]|nr:hypothetical protein [Bacteroidales bacterium]